MLRKQALIIQCVSWVRLNQNLGSSALNHPVFRDNVPENPALAFPGRTEAPTAPAPYAHAPPQKPASPPAPSDYL